MNGEAGKGSAVRRSTNWKSYSDNYDNIFRKSKNINDGFGSTWQLCSRQDCGLHVVRPGKVQCWCDTENDQINE